MYLDVEKIRTLLVKYNNYREESPTARRKAVIPNKISSDKIAVFSFSQSLSRNLRMSQRWTYNLDFSPFGMKF